MPDPTGFPALITAGPAAGLRILAVDDDPGTLEVVVSMLRTLGYEVATARSGADALHVLESAPPSIVVTDLVMPDVDGAELVRRVKASNPAIPVVVMSVLDSVERAVELLKTGADDYLTKPLSLEVLGAHLESIVNKLATRRNVEELEDLVRYAFNPGKDFVLGPSEAILSVAAKIPAMARTDATVLIVGENGTGKELVARAIHSASRRAERKLTSVSCASIPDGLWERELFGHVKGAFSDAGTGAPGLVKAADGGTLFLDEVGEIPLTVQAKLLRFLQEKEIRPVGAASTTVVDVRVVAATNRDLAAEVTAGRFRPDLYYRLNVIPLRMPSLRERKADIPGLATHFLTRYADRFSRPVVGFSPLALQRICSHDYPGNVRELENVVQQALVAARYTVIAADDIPVGDPTITEERPTALAPAAAERAGPEPSPAPDDEDLPPFGEAKRSTVQAFERSYVTRLLARHEGNVSRAALAAGLPRKSLSRIMNRYRIRGGPNGTGGRRGRPTGSSGPG